jgi:branched-chain amino acid transport system ATP-binding protein
LARALATGPKLLLLDEVLAGLNPTELEEMIDVIKSIGKMRIAIFIVEHVMHAIMAISQRIMVLHHGEVIAIGNPEKVMRNNRVIEAYLGKEVSFA